MTPALQRPGVAWLALAALLAAASVLSVWLPAALLDWQPGLAASEPWRLWTAAFVHWSGLHLAANLGATALVAAFGYVARVPLQAAAAWAVAWPLGHLALLLRPDLAHYGGLSGTLHAGLATATLWLVASGRGRRRNIGAAVLAGMLIKMLLEEPWGPTLRHGGGWDIATAPVAHACGAAAGFVCAAVALWARRKTPST